MKEYTIDATGKKIGRVASEAAVILMGKKDPSFEKHTATPLKLTIENASKLSVDPRKLETMKYAMYSGYPGGLRFDTLAKVIGKKGYSEVLNRAIKGMIPANKLRPVIMKNLSIKE